MTQLPYFYEPAVPSNAPAFTLSEATSRHCVQVLRMKAGEPLQLTDGRGNLYTAVLHKADKKHCEVTIQKAVFTTQTENKTGIAVSLLKNMSRFEWLIEKATEMGIGEITPLLCERTERQHFRYDRMQGIIISAMLQSRQCWLPVLHQPTAVSTVIAQNNYATKLIAHCRENTHKVRLGVLPASNHVQILIGPEGDFTEAEILLALQHGWQPVSLGNTRLRTETAAVVASALLIYSQ